MTQDYIPAGSAAPLSAVPVVPPCHDLIPCLSLASVLHLLTPRIGLIISLVIILAVQYARSPWRKVPSGPRGLPILGNALQFQDKTWLFGQDCKRKFGTFNFVSANARFLKFIYYRTHGFPKCPWPAYSRL